MIYPSADTIEDRVGSRYSLVVLAAKRAKQIKEGSPVLIETASTNPLTIALEEIAAGKVTITPAVAPAAELGDGTAPGDLAGSADLHSASVENMTGTSNGASVSGSEAEQPADPNSQE